MKYSWWFMDWSSKTINKLHRMNWEEPSKCNPSNRLWWHNGKGSILLISQKGLLVIHCHLLVPPKSTKFKSIPVSKSKQWTDPSQIGLLCRSLNQRSCSLKRKLNAEKKGCWRTGLFELEVHLISPVFHLETAGSIVMVDASPSLASNGQGAQAVGASQTWVLQTFAASNLEK